LPCRGIIVGVRQQFENPVEDARGQAIDGSFGALHARDEHHVVTLQRLGIELRDHLRPILQVAIHHDGPIAVAHIEPGGDCEVLAEISREFDAFDPRVGRGQFSNDVPRTVAAAIRDKNDLEVPVNRRQ